MSEELLTTRMKKATRRDHAISDILVRTKLLFALHDNKIWAEGLLIFYEIFKFLETAMKEKKEENLGKLHMPEMNRTAAFEADLSYYLGPDWKKNYKIRPSVENYLAYLKNLLETDSDLLMAYVYHLYMGLLSGGQVLARKRLLLTKVLRFEGNKLGREVTDFSGKKLSKLKTELREKMNSIAEGLDEEKKEMLVKESIKVFKLNNSIIVTVKRVGRTAFANFLAAMATIVLLSLFLTVIKVKMLE